ncbi:TPA: hypothetical protein RUX96_001754 [Aeromonas dhakensis]|nr:hypothetical protein [Aeromonas dhakensis]
MPSFPEPHFTEALAGGIPYQLLHFSIDQVDFVAVFASIDTSDAEYSAFRAAEVGFQVPGDSYDIKFDTLENYNNGTFYAAPGDDGAFRLLGFTGLRRLSAALRTCVDLHYRTYGAKLYIAVAENARLVKFYDRLVCKTTTVIDYEVINNLGQDGTAYAIKTPSF